MNSFTHVDRDLKLSHLKVPRYTESPQPEWLTYQTYHITKRSNPGSAYMFQTSLSSRNVQVCSLGWTVTPSEPPNWATHPRRGSEAEIGKNRDGPQHIRTPNPSHKKKKEKKGPSERLGNRRGDQPPKKPEIDSSAERPRQELQELCGGDTTNEGSRP